MGNCVSTRTFAVSVRVKRQDQETPALAHEEPKLQLPRLRSSEIAAAAGCSAVRRALEEMLVEARPAASRGATGFENL